MDNNTIDQYTSIDEHTFIECGDCKHFSFFEINNIDSIDGKCNRDSIYNYKKVKSTDRRCRSCATCQNPICEYGIWKCNWMSQIGFCKLDLYITPECIYYKAKLNTHE